MGGLLNGRGQQRVENAGKDIKGHRAKLGNQVCLSLLSWNKLFTVIVSSEELLLAALCFPDSFLSFI